MLLPSPIKSGRIGIGDRHHVLAVGGNYRVRSWRPNYRRREVGGFLQNAAHG